MKDPTLVCLSRDRKVAVKRYTDDALFYVTIRKPDYCGSEVWVWTYGYTSKSAAIRQGRATAKGIP